MENSGVEPHFLEYTDPFLFPLTDMNSCNIHRREEQGILSQIVWLWQPSHPTDSISTQGFTFTPKLKILHLSVTSLLRSIFKVVTVYWDLLLDNFPLNHFLLNLLFFLTNAFLVPSFKGSELSLTPPLTFHTQSYQLFLSKLSLLFCSSSFYLLPPYP